MSFIQTFSDLDIMFTPLSSLASLRDRPWPVKNNLVRSSQSYLTITLMKRLLKLIQLNMGLVDQSGLLMKIKPLLLLHAFNQVSYLLIAMDVRA